MHLVNSDLQETQVQYMHSILSFGITTTVLCEIVILSKPKTVKEEGCIGGY